MARRRFGDDDAPKGKLTRESLREAVRTFNYIRPYKWYFFGGMFLLFLSSLVFMIFPYLIGLMVDIAQGSSDVNFSLKDIGVFLIIVLVVQGTVKGFGSSCRRGKAQGDSDGLWSVQ